MLKKYLAENYYIIITITIQYVYIENTFNLC